MAEVCPDGESGSWGIMRLQKKKTEPERFWMAPLMLCQDTLVDLTAEIPEKNWQGYFKIPACTRADKI